ncbi:MAG: UDP-N-acetylmuramate--alanine ligase [Sphingomonadales bacterium]|nr:UDP-N-acetylmuramate--alanine ligase [Sphingomonadales bacterium]
MTTNLTAHPWFFCGIGGSGMLPLALILKGLGADVAGSDRSRDQGRTPEKFAWLESLGFRLHPQDGSGITSARQTLVASAAIEDTVPEIIRARALACPRMSRAELLAVLFNAASTRIALGGTSGKSTMTGMTGWILTQAGEDPTIMNGAVMKNFVAPNAPFASARVGRADVFVSEVDESDGSIALYEPTVAVLGNVTLDHKSLDELRQLFGDFLARSHVGIVNLDDPEAAALLPRARIAITFAIDHPQADIGVVPGSIVETPTGISATVIERRLGPTHELRLPVPGRHNLANALAAIAATHATGLGVGQAVAALASYAGLARRFDIIGTSPSGITVIDDFGHNPDKVAATLATLKAHPGRVIAFFQPHGYGPLRQMGAELAQTFAARLDAADPIILCDPVYFGGTVDRSEGSERIVRLINQAGGTALHIASRDDCAAHIAAIARPGDRIVVMGARDDTLTRFAHELLDSLPGQ